MRVTAQKLEQEIRAILKDSDLESLSKKKVRRQLEETFGVKLKSRKKAINDIVDKVLAELVEQEKEEEEEYESEEEESKPAKKAASKKRKAQGPKKPRGGAGHLCDKALAAVCDISTKEEITRPQCVKKIWEYIRKHELQNPEDKREILCDDKLKKIFDGNDSVTMFSMNKFLSAHLTKTGNTIRPPGEGTNGTASSKPKKKRKSNMPLKKLSKELADVCGSAQLRRTEVVKQLWVYIKKHELQNPENKKEIICDKKLKKVFDGEKSVTMFTMQKYLSPHLSDI